MAACEWKGARERGGGGVGLRRRSGVNLSTPTAPHGQTKGGERGQSARLNGQLVNTLQFGGVSLATHRKRASFTLMAHPFESI